MKHLLLSVLTEGATVTTKRVWHRVYLIKTLQQKSKCVINSQCLTTQQIRAVICSRL